MSNSQANAGISGSTVADEPIQHHPSLAAGPVSASCPAATPPSQSTQQPPPHIVSASTADAGSSAAVGVGVVAGSEGVNLDSSPRESSLQASENINKYARPRKIITKLLN
uniref:IP20149p n=1 Tax=Drosophila melanogaster TaxID=7227 RepID=A8E732_DROME|nr:IP20149p [Drosophila melanogaster]